MAVWQEEAGAEPPVLVEIDGAIGIVTLNRPDKLNAWTPAMGTLYFDALDRLGADPAVRAILVTGAGRAFCAGGDVSGLATVAGAGELGELADKRPYSWPMGVGKPVVAAIRGACVGVGFFQALCCDVRFAAEDAKFAAVFARLGLIAETGIAWNLTRLIGAGPTMDLLLSGRPAKAEEALRLGLVCQVVPGEALLDTALAYCRMLAESCSPWSMRMVKQQVHAALATSHETAFERSEALLAQAFAGADFSEGVAAFRGKRPPAFPPLPPALARIELES
jgi:enoyl-CoA hydratase/carnithine racemase